MSEKIELVKVANPGPDATRNIMTSGPLFPKEEGDAGDQDFLCGHCSVIVLKGWHKTKAQEIESVQCYSCQKWSAVPRT